MDQSNVLDNKVSQVLQLAKNCPKFATYFMKHVRPMLKNYVFGPSNENNVRKWTNNDCESLNHILKLDAKSRPAKTPDLIDLLYQIIVLHFKDFRQALYGEGNYRILKKLRKHYYVTKECWRNFSETEKTQKFTQFLENKRRKKADEVVVKSTFSNFVVSKTNIAKKPVLRKRIRSKKTSGQRYE